MNRIGMPRFLANGQAFAIVVIVVLAFLAFRGCDVPSFTSEQRASDAASLEEKQIKWAEERAERQRRAPFNMAMFFLSRLAGLALIVGAGAGAISTLTLWGWRLAASIKPTGGLFPLIISKQGGAWQIHDANRATGATTRLSTGAALVSPGWEQAQIATSLAASQVQVEQARASNVQTVATSAAPGAAQDQGNDAPVMNWPKSVALSDLLQRQGGASLDRIVLGVSPGDSGEWELVNPAMSRLVHVGCGGSSGWGKSTMLHAIIAQFVMAGGIGLALADASGSALGQWRDCNLLQWPLATEGDGITALFVEMGKELDRRAELYTQVGNPNSLPDYNKRRGALPALEPLSLVADEANSILKSNPAATQAAENLAYRGRKYGLWLIISGQRWTAAEIPPGLKNQLSTRLAFKMTSKSQSNNLMMTGDAANLNDVGRGWAIIPGRSKVEFQAPIISDGEIAALLTGQTGPQNEAPVYIDATPKQAANSLDDGQRQRIIELGRSGESITGIVKAIWGSKNGRRAKQVKAILHSDGVTG